MMKQAWRIVKSKYAATAFTGEGASRTGGRWNSRGTWVVYTSSSQSLAALETLVHLTPPVLFKYTLIEVTFDDALVEKTPSIELPSDWKEEPPAPSAKEIGDLWVRQRRSAVLEIPSAIIPGESNYLLNPGHPDFSGITIGSGISFSFDPRLLP